MLSTTVSTISRLHHRRWVGLGLLAFTLLAVGCQSPSEDAGASVAENQAQPEIDWFDGTVEEAFATAALEEKPLFLYWGAVWCPPCHYLKDKIFTRPEFIAQSRKFIAVYLDGDTDQAQAWGEKLEISGYPTVLILDPQGEEVTRLSIGIPVEEYGGVLDAALALMRPIQQVLDEVLAAGAQNADSDALSLLANYSWGQDRVLELSTEERFGVFQQLYTGTPAELRVIRSHFLRHLLGAGAQLAGDDERTAPVLTPEEIAAHRAAVLEILGDEELRRSNSDLVSFASADVVGLLEPEPGPGREELADAFLAAGAALEADESLGIMDRLYAIYTRLEIVEMRLEEAGQVDEDGNVLWPAADLDHLRSRIAWANGMVTDEGELQGVMNLMANLLTAVDLGAEAKELIASRLEETEAPHYYMGWLSSLEEDAGNHEAALDWSRRSWEAAEGPYTRFQWGSGYLRDLMRLAPDEAATLESNAVAVFDELLANADAFANRNYSRLGSVDTELRQWGAESAERAAVEDRIRQHVGARCDDFEAGDEESPQSRCRAFGDPDRDAS